MSAVKQGTRSRGASGAALLAMMIGATGCSRPELGYAGEVSADGGATTTTATALDAAAAPAMAPAITPVVVQPGLLRERATVTVDGAVETWSLVWTRPPFPTCRGAAAGTCPCEGFAPGERGDLTLVRSRAGAADEQLQLSKLFEQHETIVPTAEQPAKDGPGARLLAFGDYDHDGRASEIALQVGAGPCGHTSVVVVGVSRPEPALHVFSAAESPGNPLVMDARRDWETVRTKGTFQRLVVRCGDHGADEATTMTVRASGGALHSAETTSPCPPP